MKLQQPPKLNPQKSTAQQRPETVWKPSSNLTRKQNAFVRHLVQHPKASGTEAAAAAYNTTSRHTAEQIAHENMRKPEIMLELSKHSGTAELTMLEVMEYSKDYGRQGDKAGAAYAGVAISAARDILDRIHGKATQRIEASSKVVTISVDLTGVAENK